MLRYKILDEHTAVMADTLEATCPPCLESLARGKTQRIQCSKTSQMCRVGHFSRDKIGTVWACSNDQDHLTSKRKFVTHIGILLEGTKYINQARQQIAAKLNQRTRRFMHNLVSLNARSIQEFYNFAPQELLAGRFAEQVQIIVPLIQRQPVTAAQVLLHLNKNITAMKTEFSVFRTLDDERATLSFHTHNVRNVLLNVLHVFFPDFNEKDVRVVVDESNTRVVLDYDTVSTALYLILDNAAKYIMPGSTLRIGFARDQDKMRLSFDMLSFPIRSHEMGLLGHEGYSGEVPRELHIAGDGIGMYHTRRLLTLNQAELVARNNVDKAANTHIGGRDYEKNVFEIVFSVRHGRVSD